MVYPDEAAAIRRIEALIVLGIWPGYFRVPGGWALTYDPPAGALDSHGYLAG